MQPQTSNWLANDGPQPPRYLTLLVAGALTVVLLAAVVGPGVMADQPIPERDLRAASLSNVAQLVTQFHIAATDRGHTITLIGAYADPARTVLFLRVAPDAGIPELSLSDEQGMMNSGSNSFRTAPNDYVYALISGPRTPAGRTAHVTAKVTGLMPIRGIAGPPPEQVQGNWTLSFDVPVQPASPLPHESAFQLGALKVTIEILDLTPSVIDLQAVIDGARVEEIASFVDSAITLSDSSGTQVSSVASEVETTVSKEDLDPVAGPPSSTRIKLLWLRPRSAGNYELRFQSNFGEVHTIPIALPAAPIGVKRW